MSVGDCWVSLLEHNWAQRCPTVLPSGTNGGERGLRPQPGREQQSGKLRGLGPLRSKAMFVGVGRPWGRFTAPVLLWAPRGLVYTLDR